MSLIVFLRENHSDNIKIEYYKGQLFEAFALVTNINADILQTAQILANAIWMLQMMQLLKSYLCKFLHFSLKMLTFDKTAYYSLVTEELGGEFGLVFEALQRVHGGHDVWVNLALRRYHRCLTRVEERQCQQLVMECRIHSCWIIYIDSFTCFHNKFCQRGIQ